MKSLTEEQAKAAEAIVPAARIANQRLRQSQVSQYVSELVQHKISFGQAAQILRGKGYRTQTGKLFTYKYCWSVVNSPKVLARISAEAQANYAATQAIKPILAAASPASPDSLAQLTAVLTSNLSAETKRALAKQLASVL